MKLHIKPKKIIIRCLIIILVAFLLVLIGVELNFLNFAKKHAIFVTKRDNFSVIDENANYLMTSNKFKTHIYKLDKDKYKEIHFSDKITGASKCEKADSLIVCNHKTMDTENLGCSDSNGKIFIPIKFSEIECKIINDKPYYICKSGNEETTIYDSKGTELYHSKNTSHIASYNNQLRFIERKSRNFTIYDENQKEIVNLENDVSHLVNNKYLVVINRKIYPESTPKAYKKSNKQAIIDTNGKILIDYKYDDITPLENNSKNSQYIFIAKTEFEDKSIKKDETRDPLDEEYWSHRDIISKYELIDEKGNKLSSQMYDEMVDFKNDYLGVRLDDKWGIIDSSGKVLLPIEYKEIPHCVKMQNKLFYIIRDKGYQYIKDETFKNVIPNGRYKTITPTNEFLFTIKEGKKTGLVDKNNKVIASPKYDSSTHNSDNGYIILKSGKTNTIIDKQGNVIFKNNSITFYAYKNGLSYNGNVLFGKFIDEQGKTVIPRHINKENKFSFASKVSPIFKTSCYENNGEQLVKIKGIRGYYILKIY